MRIKISPKIAIFSIDTLIREGYDLMNFIDDDYEKKDSRNSDLDNEEETPEKADTDLKESNPAIKENEENPFKNITSVIDGFAKFSSLTAQSFNPFEDNFPEETIESYEKEYNQWHSKCLIKLEEIYMDFAPIYTFKSEVFLTKFDPMGSNSYKRKGHVVDRIESNLKILVSFYNELKDSIKSPMIFIPDTSQIWFYDFVVQLTPDSNETSLCSYMFKFGIGEWKEFSDIFAYMKGEDVEEITKWKNGWDKTVNSAYDGINRKTGKIFGFQILKKQKLLLSLDLPSRLVAFLK